MRRSLSIVGGRAVFLAPVFASVMLIAISVDLHRSGAVMASEEQGPEPTTDPAVPSSAGSDDVVAEGETFADLIRRGNEARTMGRVPEAISAYRKASRLAPSVYEARILLADTLRRSARPGAALAEYGAAVSLDPSRPEAYLGQALIRRARFDYEGAVAILEGALERVPDQRRADLLLALAETRRRQGRTEMAGKYFSEILEMRPERSSTHAGLALLAEQDGDPGSALRAWSRFLELNPDDEFAKLRLLELQEILVSIAALRATAAGAQDAPLLVELGRLLRLARDSAGAARAFGEAISIEPHNVEAVRGLALALRDEGDPGGAESAFRELLNLRPSDPTALYGLAAIARKRKDIPAERAALRGLVAARPDDLYAARAWVAFIDRAEPRIQNRAVRQNRVAIEAALDDPATALPFLRRRVLLMASLGRTPEAIDGLHRALMIDPTDPWTVEIADEILFMDPTAIETLWELGQVKARSANEDDPETLLYFARLMMWLGRHQDAHALAQRAVKIDPRSVTARSALAETMQHIGSSPDAVLKELRRAVALDPKHLVARIDLVLALVQTGRIGPAIAAARRGLEVNPDAAPLLSLMGAALANDGRLEEAAWAFAAAMRTDPADNFRLARGQYPLTLAALGRHVEARRALEGDLETAPALLYLEAWAFTRDTYHDRSFNKQNWRDWRHRYRGKLETPGDAYRAIGEMLASLGDPYTRLRHPEETAGVFLARRGQSVTTDKLGRNRPQSKTVVAGEIEGGLGYIRLTNLSDPGIVEEVRRVLLEMGEKVGIVLDLRGNPGGFSRLADAIGDLLVGPGVEAGVDRDAEGLRPHVTGGDGALTDSPIAVLVDGQTASAAERLARTLESTGRGILVGETTHGKGRAQASRILPGGVTVLVWVGEMLNRDGLPLQNRGLEPKNRRREPRVRPDSGEEGDADAPADDLLKEAAGILSGSGEVQEDGAEAPDR